MLQEAQHWSDPDVLKSKAQFYYETNPPVLRIKLVKREDAGLYRCRVDFQKSPTRNSRINLTVLGKFITRHHFDIFLITFFFPVPPTKLTILDNDGAAVLDHTVGPYREGSSVNITCMTSGGIPPPRVSWWREHALIDDSFTVLPDGSVKNVLHLTKIDRKDLNTVI